MSSELQQRLNMATSVVLMLAALSIAGSVVYRTFAGVQQPAQSIDGPYPMLVDDWEEALDFGALLGGDPNAPVTLVELVDLECPACRSYHITVIKEVLAERADDVRVIYVPYPLSYHRQAIPAALGAECADGVGRLPEWVDAVFEKQDSIGLRSWELYAADAGIEEEDVDRVADCARRTSLTDKMRAALDFGSRIGIQETPTVIVNGWHFLSLPYKAEVTEAIDAALTGDLGRRW